MNYINMSFIYMICLSMLGILSFIIDIQIMTKTDRSKEFQLILLIIFIVVSIIDYRETMIAITFIFGGYTLSLLLVEIECRVSLPFR